MSQRPIISVVTITFNDRDGLRTTIASVMAQTYKNIEYIIIDGGSTDGSLELIQQHASSLAYWVSEPDRGIYHAMNKGAVRSTGDWVIFMNAGDDFASNMLMQEIFATAIAPEVDFIYGDNIVKYPEYSVIRRSGSISALWQGSQFSHQSIFIRGEFQRANSYRLDNRISADFELFYEAHVAGRGFLKLEKIISKVSPGGLSDVARLENIAAFYRVVRRIKPSLKVHLYFPAVLVLQSIKLGIKRVLPERWVSRYRRVTRKLV